MQFAEFVYFLGSHFALLDILPFAFCCQCEASGINVQKESETDSVALHNYAQDPKEFASYCGNILEIVKNNDYAKPGKGLKPFTEGHCYEGQTILFDEFCGIGHEKEKTEK